MMMAASAAQKNPAEIPQNFPSVHVFGIHRGTYSRAEEHEPGGSGLVVGVETSTVERVPDSLNVNIRPKTSYRTASTHTQGKTPFESYPVVDSSSQHTNDRKELSSQLKLPYCEAITHTIDNGVRSGHRIRLSGTSSSESPTIY